MKIVSYYNKPDLIFFVNQLLISVKFVYRNLLINYQKRQKIKKYVNLTVIPNL